MYFLETLGMLGVLLFNSGKLTVIAYGVCYMAVKLHQ